jgi:GT2 family glycosyltransferase
VANGEPGISAIIPSRHGEVQALREALAAQTRPPDEVVVIVGISPNGRARNEGVARSEGEILFFIDDDALPGNAELVERVVAPLVADPTIQITGAAKLIPPGSSWFQRWAAREVPRIEHPVVAEPMESNPDPPHYSTELTTTCAAMRRADFEALGGFHPGLRRGVDTEFFVRARRAGYRLLLVPHAWTWHPAPETLGALWRKHFLYGVGHAQELAVDPLRARGLQRHPLRYLLFRTAILLPNIFLPFSYADPRWRLGFRPLKALTSYAAALGFVWESRRRRTRGG